jgi:hypothetical protein
MHTTEFDAKWTLEEAVAFVRSLQPAVLKCGFSLGLTGSTLTKGSSEHDVDLIVYPLRTNPEPDIHALQAVLNSHNMYRFVGTPQVHAAWRRAGSLDEKKVEVWVWVDKSGGIDKRVDIFFLS